MLKGLFGGDEWGGEGEGGEEVGANVGDEVLVKSFIGTRKETSLVGS